MRSRLFLSPKQLSVAALATILVAASAQADITLNMTEKPVPENVAAPIRDVLQATTVQLVEEDKPVYEFWFTKQLPLTAAPESPDKALDALAEVTLLGVVSVTRDELDYRNDDIPTGLYTMRFAVRPNDGNHLGVSQYRYFALLTQTSLDKTLEGYADAKKLIEASMEGAIMKHPICLSLRPAVAAEEELPALHEPKAEEKSVCVAIPAKSGDTETKLVFELVYEGHGEL